MLMKLSRTVSYALQATLQLARSRSHDPVPCRQLAADGNMPERFLLQILRDWRAAIFLVRDGALFARAVAMPLVIFILMGGAPLRGT